MVCLWWRSTFPANPSHPITIQDSSAARSYRFCGNRIAAEHFIFWGGITPTAVLVVVHPTVFDSKKNVSRIFFLRKVVSTSNMENDHPGRKGSYLISISSKSLQSQSPLQTSFSDHFLRHSYRGFPFWSFRFSLDCWSGSWHEDGVLFLKR